MKLLPCLLSLLCMQAALAQKDCRQAAYQQMLEAAYPGLPAACDSIERFTRARHITPSMTGTEAVPPSPGGGAPAVPEILTIPVVVHVLYNNGAQNISDAQVQSQIDALNRDYSGQNADRGYIPAYFAGLAADAGIRFALARVDPQGRATRGIVRRWTGVLSFSFDDRMKSTELGGDDAWDPDSYLNLWVCNTGTGLQGYSSLPGGPKDKDGVVINTAVFGTLHMSGAYNQGRTAVHETGHWFNLRHIWGDAACGDDRVDDTPPQQAPTRGCPGGERWSCGATAHGDMYMNFMDFTDDACMYMFTAGQRERMRALFAPGGPRAALLRSHALTGTAVGVAPEGSLTHPPAGFSVILYPNPASSALYIQSVGPDDCTGKTVRIYNRLGQLRYQGLWQAGQPVNIGGWEPGLYFVLINGVGDVMSKFVKL